MTAMSEENNMTISDNTQRKTALYVDLGRIVFPLFLVLMFLAPYPRGLFFSAEALLFQTAFGWLLALLGFEQILSRRGERWSPEVWAALALAVTYALSFIVAVDRHQAMMELLKYLNYFGVLFIGSRLASVSRLRAMAYTLLASAAGVELIGLCGALGAGRFPGVVAGEALQSTFGYHNALGGYLLAALATGNTLVSCRLGRLGRGPLPYVIAGLNYLAALSIVGTYSRGTWVLVPMMSLALVVALPAVSKWKSLHSSVCSLSCACFVLRGYTQAAATKNLRAGLLWLGAGLVASVLLETCWAGIQEVVRRWGGLQQRYRTIIIPLIPWVIAITVFCLGYALTAYPNFLALVLPRQVITHAETIKADEPNLVSRLDCFRTALRIWVGCPLLGFGGGAWNALYHQYQRFMYWTTEVHSHYLQVIVETGAAGVSALLAMWYFVVRHVVHAAARASDEDRGLMAGTLVGVAMLALHSAYDFDMSFPSNAYIVWGFLGALGSVARRQGMGNPYQGGAHARQVDEAPDHRRWRVPRKTTLTLPFIAAAVLCVLPLRLYHAGEAGAEASRWLSQDNFTAAERAYIEALRLDPSNPSFYIDLAHSQVGSYLVTGEDSYREKADTYMAEALRTGAYSIPVRLRVVDLFMVQGRLAEAVEAAGEVVRLVPLDRNAYQGLAKCALAAAVSSAESGRDDDARLYAEKIFEAERILRRLWAGSDDRYPRPGVTPEIRMRIGQCHAVLGDMAQAQAVLWEVWKDKQVGDEASVWLGVVLLRSGRHDEGQKLLSSVLGRRKDLMPEAERIAHLLQVESPEVSR